MILSPSALCGHCFCRKNTATDLTGLTMILCIPQVIVGQNGILATPAASALIRRRKLYGECSRFAYAHIETRPASSACQLAGWCQASRKCLLLCS